MATIKNQFNNKALTKKRKAAGLTYLQLSRALQIFEPKCSKTVVWQWEKGSQPSFRYISALCRYFGCESKEFIKHGK